MKEQQNKNNLKAQVAIERTSLSAHNLHGQVATEFFLYSAIFMFVVIAAFVIISHIQSTEVPTKEYQLVKETAEGFSGVITLAVKGGSGFTYKYNFPKKILGKSYQIYFQPSGSPWMITEWTGQYGNFSYSHSIPAYNYQYKGCLCKTKSVCSSNDQPILVSNDCSSTLLLENDGKNLTLTQVK